MNETILNTLAEKIDSLKSDNDYKQWKINELIKENEELKKEIQNTKMEKRPQLVSKEVETR